MLRHTSAGIIDPLGRGDPGHQILRQQLIDAIGVPLRAPITLITAPAGFGKTTLAVQWAQAATHPVLWVSLHSESNTPSRFLADLEQALAIGRCISNAGEREPSLETAILRIRALTEHGPATLIFDDYHVIENRDIHDIMTALIAGVSRAVSIMILSRRLSPLSLARIQVSGDVHELTEVDLRFAPDEVAKIADPETSGWLTSERIARLSERTQGWIAGIRLALISMRQVADEQIDAAIDSLSGNQWLDQYIVEEVLDALPEHLRQFVLRTSGLGSLDPDLCNAVLQTEKSAAIIDELIKRLVFIRSDARAGAVASYHALFADCVERIAVRVLPSSVLRDHHTRAAEWFEQRGRLEEALDHALRVEDWPLARRIVRTICLPLWERDLHHSLLYWMEKLPPEQRRLDHELLYWYIHKLFSTGQLREAMLQFEIAEPLWQASDDQAELGFMLGCRAFVAGFRGDADAGLQYSYRALHHFPPHHWASRMRLWTSICEKEFWRGNDDLATQAYSLAEYCRSFLPMEQRWWALNATCGRVNRYALRGDLPTAERLYRLELERFPPQLRDNEGRYRFRLAAIYLEWNELDQAQAEVDRFTRDLERFPWQFWYFEAWLTAAQAALAIGQHDIVETRLNRLFTALGDLGETHTAERARALQAQLWLEQGELLLASAWGDSIRIDECEWTLNYGEPDPYLVLLQLRIAQEDYDGVLSLATTRIRHGLELKRYAELVPLYIWQVVALRALGRTEEAVNALRSAIQLARPGRMVRSFSPLGVDIRPFLAMAIPHLEPEEEEYVRSLIGEGSPEPKAPIAPRVPLNMPGLRDLLSVRELEALGLLGTGLVNREIAERLFISERTVKKHLANIFAKLNVDNRVAAVVRARELGLLA